MRSLTSSQRPELTSHSIACRMIPVCCRQRVWVERGLSIHPSAHVAMLLLDGAARTAALKGRQSANGCTKIAQVFVESNCAQGSLRMPVDISSWCAWLGSWVSQVCGTRHARQHWLVTMPNENRLALWRRSSSSGRHGFSLCTGLAASCMSM